MPGDVPAAACLHWPRERPASLRIAADILLACTVLDARLSWGGGGLRMLNKIKWMPITMTRIAYHQGLRMLAAQRGTHTTCTYTHTISTCMDSHGACFAPCGLNAALLQQLSIESSRTTMPAGRLVLQKMVLEEGGSCRVHGRQALLLLQLGTLLLQCL